MHATQSAAVVVPEACGDVVAYTDDWAGLQRLRILDDGTAGLRVSAPAGVLRREGRVQLAASADGSAGFVAAVTDVQRVGGADLAELRRVHSYDVTVPRVPVEAIADGTMVIVGVGRDAIPVELPVQVLEASDGAIVFAAHDGFRSGDHLLLRDARFELTVVVLHAVADGTGRGRYGGRIVGLVEHARR